MFCPFIEQLLCARPDVGRWHACSHLTLLWAVGRKGPLYISILQGRKLRPGDEVICLWGPVAISKWSWEILKWLRQSIDTLNVCKGLFHWLGRGHRRLCFHGTF